MICLDKKMSDRFRCVFQISDVSLSAIDRTAVQPSGANGLCPLWHRNGPSAPAVPLCTLRSALCTNCHRTKLTSDVSSPPWGPCLTSSQVPHALLGNRITLGWISPTCSSSFRTSYMWISCFLIARMLS